MAIELVPATNEEIVEFKQAVALRYKERGLDPKQANAVFEQYMGQLAAQMGILPAPSDKVQKIARLVGEQIKPGDIGKKIGDGITSGVSTLRALYLRRKGMSGADAIAKAKTDPVGLGAKILDKVPGKKQASAKAEKLAALLKDAACKAKGKKKAMKKKAQMPGMPVPPMQAPAPMPAPQGITMMQLAQAVAAVKGAPAQAAPSSTPAPSAPKAPVKKEAPKSEKKDDKKSDKKDEKK